MSARAQRVLDAVLKDLHGRKSVLDDIDDDVMDNEMRPELLKTIEGALGPPHPEPIEALLADLRELERLYNSDRVANQHARQIEGIFDKWLHVVESA